MNTIVNALPASWQPRAKAIIAAVLSVLSIVAYVLPYVSGVPAEVGNIVGVVINVLTPAAVHQTPNVTPAPPQHSADTGVTAVD